MHANAKATIRNLAFLLLIAACSAACALEAPDEAPSDLVIIASLSAQSTPPSTPNVTPPISAQETAEALARVEIPERDRTELAARFWGAMPTPLLSSSSTSHELGDEELFWVENAYTDEVFQVTARLAYITPHVYMWVEEGVVYDETALAEAAERFENRAYPTTRQYFGSEWTPGIDGDEHLHILHTTRLPGHVLGYFYSPSEYPASIAPYSNEKEMFYVNVNSMRPDDPGYDGLLAHEFQHMIHWNVDQNEDTWLNEGLSELAKLLGSDSSPEFTRSYLISPDTQLNHWPDSGEGRGPNYGGSFLFATYYFERFGAEGLTRLVSNPLNGLAGVDDTLRQMVIEGLIEEPTTADVLFADWVIANWVNGPDVGDGRYAYTLLPTIAVQTAAAEHGRYPTAGSGVVHQYGVDYIVLRGRGTWQVAFEGSREVRIAPTITDGVVWWSNRGDESDVTLTAAFDLGEAEEAVLEYDLWFWIEEAWDYGYVEISTDGGQTWTILETPYTTDFNPHGNAYGPGYSGQSARFADPDGEGWIHEAIDLTPYVGGEIVLRFEVITDDSLNHPGMLLDNICIATIGFCDDGSIPEIWEAHGFVRHSNVLPQRFLVQLIVSGEDGSAEVLSFPLAEDNTSEATVIVGEAGAVLAVSGMTRYTTETASYTYTIERAVE